MARFDLIVADPCWSFSDKLTMSSTKRGSASQYDVLTDQDIINLDVKSIASDDALLVLWVPSSKLQVGLDTMRSWNFTQTQTFIWVKHKKEPLGLLIKSLKEWAKGTILGGRDPNLEEFVSLLSGELKEVIELIGDFDINNILSFYMGRAFRQTHEIALIGKKGNIYKHLQNKSQRSVLLDVNSKHSSKPEGLQDRLDLMFPTVSKLELFARRDRPGWDCVGNENKSTFGQDIRDSIERLKSI